jgi:hypothetical protein
MSASALLPRRGTARPLRPATPLMPWRLEEIARNVHRLHFTARKARAWEQWVLLQSDEHWDNPRCNRELYRAHLQQALERRAPVIKYGDLFCAMQGKWDTRSSKSALRPEHTGDHYLDSLVATATEWHRPFAPVLALAGPGNHETAILKRHETHLTERWVQSMRIAHPATPLRCSGFTGWAILCFALNGAQRQSYKLWFHHGYGGGGPVTRGVIQTNRRAVYVPEADIIATGHTHDQWIVPIEKIGLTRELRPRKYRQFHVTSPGYKDDYAEGLGGWEVERGGPPKPQGALWLHFTYRHPGVHLEVRLAD